MSATGLHQFDRTVQKSNQWINELQSELGWESKQRVYSGFMATLHELRDRLTPKEALDFAAQLPALLRGEFFTGWNVRNIPSDVKKESIFISRVHSHLNHNPDIDPENLVGTVFRFLGRKITQGEMEDIRSVLPKDIKHLVQLE